MVDETGATGVVELRLGTQPTGNVVVDLSVSDATEASIDVAQLTFTNANWNVPQPVTVTGLDDVLDDGDINLSLVATMNGATADPTYAAMGPENFAITNRDDDADFTLPVPPAFCRDIGMAAVNVLVTNAGVPVGSPIVVSTDQSVVDNADITVQQLNATTFAISISDLLDNVPGTTSISLTVSDAYFAYSGSFNITTLGAVPVITQDGSTLTVNPAGVSYQWYLNGAFLPGGTQQSWTASENQAPTRCWWWMPMAASATRPISSSTLRASHPRNAMASAQDRSPMYCCSPRRKRDYCACWMRAGAWSARHA
ncbi:MAG: hypothetical protein IPF41_15260 [Flavobacteriales bacterium]|nr:hypothetical protein [Flavobacteriales bacterium]